MKGRLLLATLLAGLVGCALVLGIEDKPVAMPDAGTEVTDTGPAPPDLCEHTSPPPPLAVDDDPATKSTYIVAVKNFDLVEASDAGSIGFDIDDTCTCAAPQGARHDGGPSCSSMSGPPHCDREGGIDNSFAGISYIAASESDPRGNDKSVLCGRTALLLVIMGYSGRANDSNVAVGLVQSPGLTTPHVRDGGEPRSNCNDAGRSVVYTPRWDGTDEWSSDTNFVYPLGTSQPMRLLQGYVRDWVLVARAAEGQTLPVSLGPVVVEGSQTMVVALLDPLDAARKPLARDAATSAASVRVTRGRIATRCSVSSILGAISGIKVDGIDSICPGTPFYATVKKTICASLDVMADPRQDFGGRACDAVSAAVGFVGEPAQMTPSIAPVDAGTTTCPVIESSCD